MGIGVRFFSVISSSAFFFTYSHLLLHSVSLGKLTWPCVRARSKVYQRLSTSISRKRDEIAWLNADADFQKCIDRIEHLDAFIETINEMIPQFPEDDPDLATATTSVEKAVTERAELQARLQEKTDQREAAQNELNEFETRLTDAKEHIRDDLMNFNRKYVAAIMTSTDVLALELFCEFGGDLIQFRISTSTSVPDAYQVEKAMEGFFTRSTINMETYITYWMSHPGTITRVI